MPRFLVATLASVIVVILAGSLVVQFVMIPLLSADLDALDPAYGHLQAPLVVYAVLGVVTIQVCAVCVGRLLVFVRRGRVFSSASFRWIDVIAAAVGVASLATFALGILLAPGEAVAPGAVLLVGGAGVVIGGVALIVVVLRFLLAQAVRRDTAASAMEDELGGVI